MSSKPLHQQTGLELHQAFIQGEQTASEIVFHFLKRIQHFDPDLKAFLSVLTERVTTQAEKLDIKRAQGKPLGRLAGIPIAIKDNIHIRGEMTTCASKMLSTYRAPFDATVVRLLEEEDALLIGKTNLDEFAMGSTTGYSAYHPTSNPWNLDLVPGGSSGGSAAAVAARLSPIALGTDTGGSIRQPASFTGTVGLKPSYSRVSRYGLVAFGSSLDQIGPITHSVRDAALILEVIGQPCSHDSTSFTAPPPPYLSHLDRSLQGKKVGVPYSRLDQASPYARGCLERGLEGLAHLGVEIVKIELDLLDCYIPTYYILCTAEASSNLSRFDGVRYGVRSERAQTLEELYLFSRSEGFGREVKRRILLGNFVRSSGHQAAYYQKAQKVRSLISATYTEAFTSCDLIAMPTTSTPPFAHNSSLSFLDLYSQDLYTVGANLAGLPAINIPLGLDQDQLPLGFQLLGPTQGEDTLLGFACSLEKWLDISPFLPPQFDQEVD